MPITPDIPGRGGVQVPNPGVATLKTQRGTAAAVALDGLSWPVKGSMSWGYLSGTGPQVAVIPMLKPYANALADQLVEDVTLAKTGRTEFGEPLEQEYQKLWCILRPPVDYNHAAIIITDDRWRWKKECTYRVYNLKRKANDQHVFAKTTSAGKLGLQEARNYFVPWTIMQDQAGNPTRPWTALDIVLDVLQNVLGYTPEEIDVAGAATSDFTPMNIDVTGANADQVIARFLNLSDNSLYIEDDGRVAIYANRAPAGVAELQRWFPDGLPSLRSGAFEVIDQKASRPVVIDGTLEKELELLCQYKESAHQGQTTAGDQLSPELVAKNMLDGRIVPMDNVTITLIENQVGNLPRGSVVTIEEALEAFGRHFGGGSATLADLRSAYGTGVHAALIEILRDPGDASLLDPLAGLILNRILEDYRTLFRLHPAAMDRLKDINAVLADVIFPETGLRAPSEVYSVMSWRLNLQARVNDCRRKAQPLDSFRDPATGSARDHYQPIPASAKIVDKDMGLLQITFGGAVDRPGLVVDIIPGEAEDDSFYTDGFGDNRSVHGFEGMHGLKADWECSVILSGVPLVPNDASRVQRIRTERPEDIEEGDGPRVVFHSDLDTARFALPAVLNKYRNPARSLTSPDGWVNKAICNAVIQQEGRRRWLTFADQVSGNVEMGWTETTLNLRPFGTVQQIVHTIASSGRATVSTQAQPITDGPRIENMLPAPVLELLFRQLRRNEPAQGGRS
jgi:hypothetical protein